MAKKAKIVAALVQLPLPIRGYTLCDSDWRYPALRNLHTLETAEEAILEKMESGEPISDADYDKLEADLQRVNGNALSLWSGMIAPQLGQWWG